MNAAVVDQVDLQHPMSAGSQQLAYRPAQQVVADMAQVQRLIRIGAGEFHHDGPAGSGQLPEIGLRRDLGQIRSPVSAGELKVEEALDHVEARNLQIVFTKPGTDFRGSGFRRFAAGPQQRENDERYVAFKLLAGRLHLNQPRCGFNVIKSLHATACSLGDII